MYDCAKINLELIYNVLYFVLFRIREEFVYKHSTSTVAVCAEEKHKLI